MDPSTDLDPLIQSRHPVVAVATVEEDRLVDILKAIAAKRGLAYYVWTLTEGLRLFEGGAALYGSKGPVQALGNAISIEGDALFLFHDLHRHFAEPEVVRKLRDVARTFRSGRRTLVLSAPQAELPTELQDVVVRFTLDLPEKPELRNLVRRLLQDLSRRHRIKVTLPPAEVNGLLDLLKGLTLAEAERAVSSIIVDDWALTRDDLKHVLKIKKEVLDREGLLDYSLPDEGLAQIGGLENLKKWLALRKAAFGPAAKTFGLDPPKGILLLGVQGCGKTAAARAIASEWHLPLIRMEAGRLYEKFMGESEKKLDRALAIAERLAPCVLMVDEIEKALASSANSDADAGLSQRILARLLAWLQERTAPIFVVATCNQVAQLPPELMRKGRFDETFFVDLPGAPERAAILGAHLKKRGRDPSLFDMDALVGTSKGFSGAEIEQAVVSGLYGAFAKKKDLDTPCLIEEFRSTKPLSVVRAEDVQALRDWARDRTVPAN